MPRREASFTVNAPPEALWKFIRDFEALCTCIPGVERIQVVDDRTAELTVKEKVGVVPMIVDLRAQIESETPPHALHATAKAEHLVMEIDVKLRAAGAGTELMTVFDVTGEGPLKPIVDRLFERRATERTAQFARALQSRFGAGSPEPSASPATVAAAPAPQPHRALDASLRSKLGRYSLGIAAHLLLLAAWYLFVRFGEVPRFVMPGPVDTVRALFAGDYGWGANTLATATEIFGGYALALVVGVFLALLFTWSKTLEAFMLPLLVTLNMIPKVALGPLIIVWFKYGIFPNSMIAFSIAVFPILLTTARGLREIEPELLDLVRSLRGSRWQLFTKIQLPGALPYIFSGMKVGAILAVAGAIVGEFLGSDKGLGYLMLQVQVTLDTPAMFMAVILITLLGVVLYGAVMLLEHLFVPRDARLA